MSSNALVLTLIAIFSTALVYGQCKHNIKESFGMLPAFTVKTERVVQDPKTTNMFAVPSNYQSTIAPRMINANYGANIRYNLPPTGMQAADKNNPLSYPERNRVPQIKERYGKNGAIEITNQLPVETPNNNALNNMGEPIQQPIVYDRYMYANQSSRLRAAGDQIRGDLPIVPVNDGWFRPSVIPSRDLNSGSLMAMGGTDLKTNKELLALKSASSGNALHTGSGINYSIGKNMFTTAAGGDVHVSAYP